MYNTNNRLIYIKNIINIHDLLLSRFQKKSNNFMIIFASLKQAIKFTYENLKTE